MNDYERIAQVIRYIEGHQAEQPSLSVLAGVAGLSESRFHRLFSAWAGITPKDFLQCLSLAQARAMLRQGRTVLEAAFDAGLSGPGRLHDLAVTLEAATPGEIKSGGEGWTMAAGFADTPFGECLIGRSPRGICHLSFVGEGREDALRNLRVQWPRAVIERDDGTAHGLAAQMFVRGTAPAARAGAPVLRLMVRGSTFQVRVWRALLSIPAGTLASYGGLASALGSPSAARAVGSAVAKNDIAFLIPCHRVIRETGVVGEYRWGHERKRAMLAWEGSRAALQGGAG